MCAKIAVIGAGMVGHAMAIDLNKSGHRVLAIDIDQEKIQNLEALGINGLVLDFTQKAELEKAISKFPIVVSAVPGKLGFQLLEHLIFAGKNVVDISFCPEDYMELDKIAKSKKVCIVCDMGVAPGMCNVLLGYHDSMMKVDSYKCIVGGLPVRRTWPLEYIASWSPEDVIEEYTRPARFKSNGVMLSKPALSDAELVNLDPVGTLEEWNSDGLRSLLTSMPHIPNLVEKTLRYPGTIKYLKVLRELGFFSSEEIQIGNQKIRPVDLSSRLLFPVWKAEKGEREFTIMQVKIEGRENGKEIKYIYDLYDEYHKETDTMSMARTTGYTCTAATELLCQGKFGRKGINPPEFIGREKDCAEFILDYLSKRGVNYKQRIVKE